MTFSLVLLVVLQTKAAPLANLKTVELAGKYTIQVPSNFSVHRLAFLVPVIAFDSVVDNRRTSFEVTVEHYGSDKTVILDKDKPHFTISAGREVYYEWGVADMAYDCTMNSPCPVPVPARIRYITIYQFKLFDKPNNTLLTFGGTYTGPSKEVSDFEGVGKLLREVVIPSLSTIP